MMETVAAKAGRELREQSVLTLTPNVTVTTARFSANALAFYLVHAESYTPLYHTAAGGGVAGGSKVEAFRPSAAQC